MNPLQIISRRIQSTIKYPVMVNNSVIYINGPLNEFGGVDHYGKQILKSSSGYYIGYLEPFISDNFWVPIARDSADFWSNRKSAEEAMLSGLYARKLD